MQRNLTGENGRSNIISCIPALIISSDDEQEEKYINPHRRKASRFGKAWSFLLTRGIKQNWAMTWYTFCKPVSTIRVTAGQKKPNCSNLSEEPKIGEWKELNSY